jgi:hypothetical protein
MREQMKSGKSNGMYELVFNSANLFHQKLLIFGPANTPYEGGVFECDLVYLSLNLFSFSFLIMSIQKSHQLPVWSHLFIILILMKWVFIDFDYRLLRFRSYMFKYFEC